MSRQRMVSDSVWTELGAITFEDRYCALWLLTNPYSGMCGAYRVVERVMSASMGWSDDQTRQVLARLEARGLLLYREGWVLVRYWWNHNSLPHAVSPKMRAKFEKEIKQVLATAHSEVAEALLSDLERHGFDTVSIQYPYPIDTVSIPYQCGIPTTTTNNSTANTTTTRLVKAGMEGETNQVGTDGGGDDDLVFPAELSADERAAATNLLSGADATVAAAQAILDVLAASLSSGQIRKSPLAVLGGLCRRYQAGTFDPTPGLHLSAKRRRRLENERAVDAAKRKGIAAVTAVATKQQRGDEEQGRFVGVSQDVLRLAERHHRSS